MTAHEGATSVERQADDRYPQVDTGSTEHEEEVAEHEETGGPGSDAAIDPRMAGESRPTAEEDLAAERSRGDESTEG
jgi:hypothetical protein